MSKPSPRLSQKGQWTQAALEAKALEQERQRDKIRRAVAFCKSQHVKAKKAVKYAEQEGFAGVEWHCIHRGLRGELKWLHSRCEYEILTEVEGSRLEDWLLKCAQNCAPAKEQQGDGLQEVSKKIVELLKARMVDNRKKHDSIKFGAVPLTKAEMRLMAHSDAHVSHVWWAHFRAKHPKVQVKKANSDDEKRVKKRTDAVVDRHFNGTYGLRAELLDAGIMDPETETYDPSRLLWLDELGQFIDYNAVGKRESAIGERGKALRCSDKVNREVLSVLNTHGADGFQYGCQVNAARKGFTQAMVDCMVTPDWAPSFNDTIYELDKKSCSLLVSTSEKGSQTAQTFLELLEHLALQITARSEARTKMGLPPIVRPVVLGSDNHNSRFGEDVIAAATANESRLGIRLFLEESNVSGFLQWPDQLNHQFHGAYNKAKKEYKICHKRIYGEEPDIGIPEALEIIGGCKEFNLQGMWFTWTTAANIIAACRKVGISGGKLDPSLVDRSNFVKVIDALPTTPQTTLEEAVAKAGEGKRGMAKLTAERDAALAFAKERDAQPFDPLTIPGLLEPKMPSVTKRKRDQTRIEVAEGGSVTLRNLKEKGDAKKAERALEEARLQEKRVAREAKKEAAQYAAEYLVMCYELCADGCTCDDPEECPVKGMKRCEHCGDIKRRKCAKPVCKAALAPLMLTHVPEE